MAASPSSAAEHAADGGGPGPLEGVIELVERRVPVRLRPHGRLALEARPGEPIEDGARARALTVALPGGEARLGPCRFAAGPEPGSGRLLFLENLYDCRALCEGGRVVDLRVVFDSLPAVLGQKERIRPELRDHAAALTYNLSVYRRFFDEQDRALAAEPPDAAVAGAAALLATEGQRFLAYLDGRVEELRALVRGYTPEEHERHGFYLRRQLWPYLMASEFLRRTNLKPCGYPGDAEVLRMVHEDAWLGASTFAQLMHRHPLTTAAAAAVRDRPLLVARELAAARARFPGGRGGRTRVLSLACGPACELHELLCGGPEQGEGLELLLLDQDPAALELARRAVRAAEVQLGRAVPARYEQGSARTMLRARDLKDRLGECGFVYSMGLFDYLTTPVARAVLARAYELLAPGGTLLVGNFHVGCPTRVHMDYWGDWPLVYRTEEAMLALAEGLPEAGRAVVWDGARCQLFLRVTRPA